MSRALVVLSLLTLMTVAQGGRAQETVQLEKFRVLLTTGERIEGHDGQLDENELRGMSSKDTALVIPRTGIRALDRSLGTKAGKYALMGAGIGLGTALLAYIAAESEASSDPYKEVDDSRVAPIMLGFTAGGALIGMAIGSGSQQWEKVPVQMSLGFNTDNGEIRMLLRFPI